LQVPGTGGPPHFKLHIQPGKPTKHRNQYGQVISHAGEGKGLQVFPGSVTEVTAEVRVVKFTLYEYHNML
jgi:hypothetical protein